MLGLELLVDFVEPALVGVKDMLGRGAGDCPWTRGTLAKGTPARWGRHRPCYVRAVIAIDALAGRSIFQIAFVVNNLEEALERDSRALNSGPWRCYTLRAEGHEACDYRGGATSFASRLALNEGTPQLDRGRRTPLQHAGDRVRLARRHALTR